MRWAAAGGRAATTSAPRPTAARSAGRKWRLLRRSRMTVVKRRLHNVAAAVSLVVCLSTAALWIRSYFRIDWTVREDQGWYTHGAWISKGQIVLYKQMPPMLWKDRQLGPGHWTMWHLQATG